MFIQLDKQTSLNQFHQTRCIRIGQVRYSELTVIVFTSVSEWLIGVEKKTNTNN